MVKLNHGLARGGSLPLNLSKLEGDVASLPERVLVFGTGVLLRGLPLYFIEKANQQGLFNGRAVLVKSTGTGGTEAFDEQNGLYTLHIQGIENGKEVKNAMLVSAISRVLPAASHWNLIERIAADPHIETVISNTTEVGIVLDENDRLDAQPPASFLGKLTALLYRRFQHFKGDPGKGWTILPTELISDNGSKLKEIVVTLARQHGLGSDFLQWLDTANDFCTTLVDRIVPGRLPGADTASHEQQWGYRDSLAILAEPFRLWAIEPGTERVRRRLSFSPADPGMVLTDDITKFKELKLRLLNGTHTFCCALALLCGFETVKDAMRDETFAHYVNTLMNKEIVPAIVGNGITEAEAVAFAKSVTDRFSNPFLDHRWLSISLHYTSKMRMRNVLLLQEWTARKNSVPACMALGFAAYLRFMKSQKKTDGTHEGQIGGQSYVINDEHAGYFAQLWAGGAAHDVVRTALAEESLWGTDLTAIDGFADTVAAYLGQLESLSAIEVVKQVVSE